jgi:glycosyltransferase involved in cell wall biosynthesis
MIKILYIIDKMKPAGAQTHLAEVVSGLDKANFSARLVTLEELGVRRIYGLSGMRGLLGLIRLIKKERFDIVQTYLFSENIFGVVAAKLAGASVVITGRRDTGMLCQGGRVHVLAYRLTNPFVNKIICVSEAVRRGVLEKERVAPDKVEVIYNGVDIEKFEGRRGKGEGRKSLKVSLGIGSGELVVGMIANFSWIKGHEVLIKAAEAIVKEVPNVKFLLVGDGVLLEAAKAEVRRQKTEKNFIFLGKRKDIPELLSIMDVSLNLSYSEGMSNTILESMAAGLPVVATAVDGNLENVDEETGILVTARDPSATAEAILILLKDRGLRERLGDTARQRASEEFDSKQMVKKMENLYEQLCKK